MSKKVLKILVATLVTALLCAVTEADTKCQTSQMQSSSPQLSTQSKVRVLFMVGGGVHNDKELPELMKNVLEGTKQFDVTITQDRDQFKTENIRKYDVVMIYTTGGNLSAEQEQGLVKFVESGGGLVGIHSATDSFKNSDAYWKLMWGRFRGHGYGTFTVKITGKRHPIVQGMEDFQIKDETYQHTWHPDSKAIVLMRRADDGDPSSWVQYVGKGRVFVTGLGHGKEAWENPAFQKMIERALLWADFRLNP